MRRELGDRLLTEEQTVMVSRNRSDDLEIRLRASNAELVRAKAERDKNAQERARLESEWQAQFEAAKNAAERSEAARKEEVARSRGFEEQLRRVSDKLKQQESRRVKAFETQLANFRQERHEIFSKFSAEQQGGAQVEAARQGVGKTIAGQSRQPDQRPG
jgi:DNA repair exonuclease SbcCD ATPase subunit